MSAKHLTGKLRLVTEKGGVVKGESGRWVTLSAYRRFAGPAYRAALLAAKKKSSKKEPVFDAATAVEMLDKPQAPNAALLKIFALD